MEVGGDGSLLFFFLVQFAQYETTTKKKVNFTTKY